MKCTFDSIKFRSEFIILTKYFRMQYVPRLMHLFEGGILEKMTNAEYERMIQMNQMNEENIRTSLVDDNNHQQQQKL